MYIATHHRSLLGFDVRTGRLLHTWEPPVPDGTMVLVEIPDSTAEQLLALQDGTPARFSGGPLDGCEYVTTTQPATFSLRRGGLFAGAEMFADRVEFNREAAREWERFRFVSQEIGQTMLVPIQGEHALARKVEMLQEAGRAVCLHFGCGPRLIEGFLNIDKTAFREHADNYYKFDFTERPWPIPDACVDYVYSEDFIEHIPQKNQIAFLAEALRVLKPGCYNRVNTPCLREAMKRSDFSKGFAGVYFQEFDNWGHIALFTPESLRELALIIGYRHVLFTAKRKGTSPYAVPDIRPGPDRDDLVGNIFADLLK